MSVDASLDPGLRAQLAAVADELGAGDPEPLGPGTLVQVTAPDGAGAVVVPEAGAAALLDRRAARARPWPARCRSPPQVRRGPQPRPGRARDARRRGPVVVAVGDRTVVSDAAVERVELAPAAGRPRGGAARRASARGSWPERRCGRSNGCAGRPRRSATAISTAGSAVPATRDEIAALGTTMNALLARLQEALDRERGFVADAGHELRTPLAILRTELELAARPGRSRQDLVAVNGKLVSGTFAFQVAASIDVMRGEVQP